MTLFLLLLGWLGPAPSSPWLPFLLLPLLWLCEEPLPSSPSSFLLLVLELSAAPFLLLLLPSPCDAPSSCSPPDLLLSRLDRGAGGGIGLLWLWEAPSSSCSSSPSFLLPPPPSLVTGWITSLHFLHLVSTPALACLARQYLCQPTWYERGVMHKQIHKNRQRRQLLSPR